MGVDLELQENEGVSWPSRRRRSLSECTWKNITQTERLETDQKFAVVLLSVWIMTVWNSDELRS